MEEKKAIAMRDDILKKYPSGKHGFLTKKDYRDEIKHLWRGTRKIQMPNTERSARYGYTADDWIEFGAWAKQIGGPRWSSINWGKVVMVGNSYVANTTKTRRSNKLEERYDMIIREIQAGPGIYRAVFGSRYGSQPVERCFLGNLNHLFYESQSHSEATKFFEGTVRNLIGGQWKNLFDTEPNFTIDVSFYSLRNSWDSPSVTPAKSEESLDKMIEERKKEIKSLEYINENIGIVNDILGQFSADIGE
jgi:hypothetical protein